MRVGILTISDRASRGEREDRSGPLLREKVQDQGWDVILFEVVS
ncbi:MAG TPA: molybdenum cofactor biosynthesis protein, partial [Anaerolineae bacterium]|nr:molybdenum cofactor biosynthesis protein [Anaerolineae bacterium]